MKGIRSSSANKNCAMCRVPFALENIEQDLSFVPELSSEVKWFYSGRGGGPSGGWWLYDERTSEEIELAFQDKEKKQHEIYIVGFIYTVDFEKMVKQLFETTFSE